MAEPPTPLQLFLISSTSRLRSKGPNLIPGRRLAATCAAPSWRSRSFSLPLRRHQRAAPAPPFRADADQIRPPAMEGGSRWIHGSRMEPAVQRHLAPISRRVIAATIMADQSCLVTFQPGKQTQTGPLENEPGEGGVRALHPRGRRGQKANGRKAEPPGLGALVFLWRPRFRWSFQLVSVSTARPLRN